MARQKARHLEPLQGFSFPESHDPLTDPSLASFLLADFYFLNSECASKKVQMTRREQRQARLELNLRIILESVVFFSEFRQTDLFWTRLSTSLRIFRNPDRLKTIVTAYCDARKSYHRTVPYSVRAPTVIAALADKCNQQEAMTSTACKPDVEARSAWTARARHWLIVLNAILGRRYVEPKNLLEPTTTTVPPTSPVCQLHSEKSISVTRLTASGEQHAGSDDSALTLGEIDSATPDGPAIPGSQGASNDDDTKVARTQIRVHSLGSAGVHKRKASSAGLHDPRADKRHTGHDCQHGSQRGEHSPPAIIHLERYENGQDASSFPSDLMCSIDPVNGSRFTSGNDAAKVMTTNSPGERAPLRSPPCPSAPADLSDSPNTHTSPSSTTARLGRLESLVERFQKETENSCRDQGGLDQEALKLIEERLRQLERNNTSPRNLEAEIEVLHSRMRGYEEGIVRPRSPPPSSPSLSLTPPGTAHLNYLRVRDVKALLEGAGDEMGKLRKILISKLKDQDFSNEGMTKQSYLSEVVWQLDCAIEKAKKGVLAL